MDKILYWHIPKTGGMYVIDRLRCGKNMGNKRVATVTTKQFVFKRIGHEICKYHPEKYSDFYKFTTVRDPVERLISSYFCQAITFNKLHSTRKMHDKYNITSIQSFLDNYKRFYYEEIHPVYARLKKANNAFVASWENGNYLADIAVGQIHFYPHWWFVCDDNQNLLVDKVVKTEDINQFLLARFNMEFTKKANTHAHSKDDYALYASKQNIKDIYEIYEDDYRIFNLDYN